MDGRYQNPRAHCRQAKALRRQSPLAERLLGNALSTQRNSKGKNSELKFRRQHPLYPYIADFACIKARLIVELDGASHDNAGAYDARRDKVLQDQGWTVMRFSNDEIYTNLEGVVMKILAEAQRLRACSPACSPSPNPSREGAGGGLSPLI